MAYVIGLATEKEIEILKITGCDIKDSPKELITKDCKGRKMIMINNNNYSLYSVYCKLEIQKALEFRIKDKRLNIHYILKETSI